MDFVLKHYQEGRFDTQKALERFNEAHGIKQKPRRRVLPWVSGIVAAAAAVVLCVFLFHGNDQQIQIMANAEVQEFVLPDGSHVTLAPGSRLSYSEKSPRKTLLEGKAFFEVARDESAPFEISADGRLLRFQTARTRRERPQRKPYPQARSFEETFRCNSVGSLVQE